jgi:hypothetical protein
MFFKIVFRPKPKYGRGQLVSILDASESWGRIHYLLIEKCLWVKQHGGPQGVWDGHWVYSGSIFMVKGDNLSEVLLEKSFLEENLSPIPVPKFP